MKLHPNAKTTPASRALLVHRVLREGWSVLDAVEALGISPRTGYKWLTRYQAEGRQGLHDRSSAPLRTPNATPGRLVGRVERLRRKRHTAWEIAEKLKMAVSTVSALLKRLGLGRLSFLEPKPVIRRYERKRAGELLHIDTKKLAKIQGVGHRIHGDRRRKNRGRGWEFVHVCVDDASRAAYIEVHSDEKKESAVPFLERAVAWFASLGVSVERVLTDNGSAYRSKLHRMSCEAHGIRHLRTRPYTPRTNGKAERFIQTLLRRCAYARPYRTSAARTRALDRWIVEYNHQRPHHGIGRQTPMDRLEAVR